jgi:signal transduction histidine kinase
MGLFLSTEDLLLYTRLNYFTHLLPMNLLQALAWGLTGLGVLGMAYHIPVGDSRRKCWVTAVIHVTGALILSFLGLLLVFFVTAAFWSDSTRAASLAKPYWGFRAYFNRYFHFNVLLMGGVLGAYHAFRLYLKSTRQQLAASELENQLVRAQNQALRMQLQPHFLFNTLNSIATLVHSDPDSADRMMVRLADLLRSTLDSATTQEVELRQEVAFIEKYLAIELIRYSDRLHVTFDIAPDTWQARVPAFLLQPLVENAIKHGIAHVSGPSTIFIRAHREGECLNLEVEDTGQGFEGLHEGIGTRNTTARLQLLYKDQQAFALSSKPGQGTVASIRIPWQVLPQSA